MMYVWLLLLAADAGAVAISIQALRVTAPSELAKLARWARGCAWVALAGALLVAGSAAWWAMEAYRTLTDSLGPAARDLGRTAVLKDVAAITLIALLLLIPPFVTRAAVARRASQALS